MVAKSTYGSTVVSALAPRLWGHPFILGKVRRPKKFHLDNTPDSAKTGHFDLASEPFWGIFASNMKAFILHSIQFIFASVIIILNDKKIVDVSDSNERN